MFFCLHTDNKTYPVFFFFSFSYYQQPGGQIPTAGVYGPQGYGPPPQQQPQYYPGGAQAYYPPPNQQGYPPQPGYGGAPPPYIYQQPNSYQ